MLPPVFPKDVTFIFTATTFLTLIFLLLAARKRWMFGRILIIGVILLLAGMFGAVTEFTLKTNSFPPGLMVCIAPSLLLIIGLFVFPSGRRFMDDLSPVTLTWLHVVRLPVEIVLYWLCLIKTIPVLMTFEGRNFDILAGVT